jgi:S-formylglutathione hydrolase FrmB
VKKLADTDVHVFTSTGVPGESDLTDPAMVGTVAMESVLYRSNQCFKQADDAAGVEIGWHVYPVGTHAWSYGTRTLTEYFPLLMDYFERSGALD